MQRIGRVNRVGSKADKVYIYNFYPTAKVDNDIALQKRAFMKLQAFHSALGEDSQIYSTLEEFESFELFNENVDGEKDKRLEYLMELRAFKASNLEAFKRIKDMPLRARVGRKNKILKGETVTFIKAGKRDSFFQIAADGNLKTLTFLEAAAIFKAFKDEKGIPLHTQHHQQIDTAITQFDLEIKRNAVAKKVIDTTQSPTQKQAIAYLNGFIPARFVNEKEREELLWAKKAIQKGTFTNLPRKILKLKRQLKKKPVKPIETLGLLQVVIKDYYKNVQIETNAQQPATAVAKIIQPEIIISESFNA